MKIIFCLICCFIGITAGAMAGQWLGENAPLFGGINLMGEPGSPARKALVPGHIALVATAGGTIGLILGAAICLARTPRSTPATHSRRELPSKIDFPK